MRIRDKWSNNKNEVDKLQDAYYSKEETIDSVQQNFDFRRYFSAEGAEVIIDDDYDFPVHVLIQEHTNPYNAELIDKKIHFPHRCTLERGSKVDWFVDNNWRRFIAMGETQDRLAYKSNKIVESNYLLKWINDKGMIVEEDSLVGNFRVTNDGVVRTGDMELGDRKIQLIIPRNGETDKFERDQRFVITKFAYEITSIDDYTMPGLLIIVLTETQKSNNDNFEEGVADYHKLSVFTVRIINGDFSIIVGNSEQLTFEIKRDDEIITDISEYDIIFESSDNDVLTADETGLVTAISEGKVVVHIYADELSDSIEIDVVDEIEDNYAIELDGLNSLRIGQSSVYYAKVLNNGQQVHEDVVFDLYNKDGSLETYAEIVDYTGSSVEIRVESNASNIGKHVVLVSTLESDETVFEELEIRIQGFI